MRYVRNNEEQDSYNDSLFRLLLPIISSNIRLNSLFILMPDFLSTLLIRIFALRRQSSRDSVLTITLTANGRSDLILITGFCLKFISLIPWRKRAVLLIFCKSVSPVYTIFKETNMKKYLTFFVYSTACIHFFFVYRYN